MADKDQPTTLIDAITQEMLDTYGADQGIAILGSVICQLYTETDGKQALILTQPATGVLVITTTLDASDQIPEILQKTIDGIPSILEEITKGGTQPPDQIITEVDATVEKGDNKEIDEVNFEVKSSTKRTLH